MPKVSGTERWRLFVAVEIPEAIKAAIAGAQEDLRRELSDLGVSWANPALFHLTLKFLGSVDAQQVETLADALETACQTFAPLQLRAQGLGAFPDMRFPRVIWVGLSDGQGKLVELQSAVETVTRQFTVEPAEDRFTGHVTLGRAKRLTRREAQGLSARLCALEAAAFGEWTATEVNLMRSQLSSEGARHSLVKALPLVGAP
jgi:RNA 2',3'-cyclic 3'-phosphodiesterase